MEILYTSLLYRKEDELRLQRACRGNVSAAHYKIQTNLIQGLRANGTHVTVAVCVPAASYPKHCTQLRFPDRSPEADYTELGYLNFYGLKHHDRREALLRFARKWLRDRDPEACVILAYDAYVPFLEALSQLKTEYPGLRTALVVPDLLGQGSIESENHSFLIRKVLEHRQRKFETYVGHMDRYILLTRQMAPALECPEGSYLVMEGMVEQGDAPQTISFPEDRSRKVMLYAGELARNVDLDTLLQAFSRMPEENLQLWICGSGPMEAQIRAAEGEDSRIRFFGRLSQDALRELEKQVDIYINPRQNRHAYTQYSFPSKNLEYLKTGKPVIAYMLDGIPQEYAQFLRSPADDSVEALVQTIRQTVALDMPDLQAQGLAQSRFVYTHKSAAAQAKRILRFLEEGGSHERQIP